MKLQHVARLVLAPALATTVFFALYPGRHHPQLLASDKAEHFICFTLLNLGLLFAFPAVPAVVLGLLLLALGAGFELLQATALIGRDAELADWLFELLAVVASAVPIVASGVRSRLLPPP
jgi:VanZ family protein